jgi:hypothetical protein
MKTYWGVELHLIAEVSNELLWLLYSRANNPQTPLIRMQDEPQSLLGGTEENTT